ncbi:MAG: SAM-dependent chlorinase/fluorinase [Elusimicrobia bacterium]|nr:SAM-dependent chlorinase/fluorinase [Elusimicrobiota bacterium]
MSGVVAAFITDFGLADHYVGTMKAVLVSLAPVAQIIDITHNVPPQDVRAAAFQLLASYKYHPTGTLFVCVVDPGVGSDRRIIYAEAGAWRFLAPDNGLLSWTLAREKPTLLVDMSTPPGIPPPSRTFHARDVFAPLAARLLKGEPPASLGARVNDIARLPFPSVQKTGARWRGEVIAVDVFGNLVTNLVSAEVEPLAAKSKIWIDVGSEKTRVRGLSPSYAAAPEGKLLAIDGSSGFIEISVRNGSAAAATKLKVGSPVTVHFRT